MRCRIDVDQALVEEAVILGSHKSRTDAVNAALEEYVQTRKIRRVLDLSGSIDFDPEYNYKVERRRPRT